MATAIPVVHFEADASTEAPAKASFWARAKARVVNTAKRIASPLAAAGRTTAKAVKTAAVTTAKTVKHTAIKTGRAVKSATKAVANKFRGSKSNVPEASRLWRVRRAADSATSKTIAWIRDTWRRVVKPFLGLRAVVFTIILGAGALVVAPVTTLAVVFAVGAGLLGLSYLVETLEASTAPAARFVLKAIEFIAQVLKVAVYAAAAIITVALCTMSAAFAVTEVLELGLRYFNVREAVGYATMAYCLLTGQWGSFLFVWMLVTLSRFRTGTKQQRSIDRQVVESAGNRRVEIPVVKNDTATPRRVKLPACSACGVDDGGARYGLRNHKNLCGECFKALDVEDTVAAAKDGRLTKTDLAALRKGGVKVPRQVTNAVNDRPTSKRVALSLEEIAKLSAVANSRDDASKIYWTETAWWYAADGKRYTREWLGFVDGRSVAAIEYQHMKPRRGYIGWLLGVTESDDREVCRVHTLTRAQEAVADELSDQGNLIGGMLNTLRDETPAVEPSVVLVFQEVNEFDSPEAHIAHVRKTQGDEAASKLEEQYLQKMLEAENAS